MESDCSSGFATADVAAVLWNPLLKQEIAWKQNRTASHPGERAQNRQLPRFNAEVVKSSCHLQPDSGSEELGFLWVGNAHQVNLIILEVDAALGNGPYTGGVDSQSLWSH